MNLHKAGHRYEQHDIDCSFWREKMLLLLFLLIGMIVHSGLINSGDLIAVRGRLGYDLHLKVEDACRTNHTNPFDIRSIQGRIGTYHKGLKGLGSYDGRLTYDERTCTVTLNKLTDADGTEFWVHFYIKDAKTVKHYINYTVIMNTSDSRTTDPPHPIFSGSTEPTAHNKSQGPTGGLRSFVSFCFSLDSVVNIIFTFVIWILIQKRFCERLEEHSANFALEINCCFTFLCQVISVILISIGRTYPWLLMSIPIFLLMDIVLYFGCLLGCVGAHITTFMDRFSCACGNDDMVSRSRQIAQYIWTGFILLLQVAFTVCVRIICYTIDDDNSRWQSPNIGYAVLAFIFFFALKLLVFLIVYVSTHLEPPSSEHPTPKGATQDNSSTHLEDPLTMAYNICEEDIPGCPFDNSFITIHNTSINSTQNQSFLPLPGTLTPETSYALRRMSGTVPLTPEATYALRQPSGTVTITDFFKPVQTKGTKRQISIEEANEGEEEKEEKRPRFSMTKEVDKTTLEIKGMKRN